MAKKTIPKTSRPAQQERVSNQSEGSTEKQDLSALPQQPANLPPIEAAATEPAVVPEPGQTSTSQSFPIVGIGASAGGLEAFRLFLRSLPPDTGMAFVLVQHMDPTHESMLNRLLAKDTTMPVTQVIDNMAVERDCVYVIPPNAEMRIHQGVLRLVARPGGATRHTPIDTFLCSLAEDHKSRAIGIVLSGIGSDGTKGLQAIKAEGGITFAQEEASAKYPGMPLHAISMGCVDLVLPPDKIAQELAQIIRHPYLEFPRREPSPEPPPGENGSLRKILSLLRSASGVDFANYKQTTVRRRIARRMLVRRCETLPQYASYLEQHPDEASALFQDVLIHVTNFFREPEVFQSLQTTIFPRIAATLEEGQPIRIWVPGCSTGEEVYSILITLHEYLGETANPARIQVFGTDISATAVEKARAGIYSESGMAEVSPERLRRYFVPVEGGHQIAKMIRELCVFARHDLTKDPPFSRMDLISCRNVLIYMAPVLQKRILNYFHYALKPTGFLVLGQSEGVSASGNLFSLDDRKANVYSRETSSRPVLEFREEQHDGMVAGHRALSQAPSFDLRKEAEHIILNRYSPAALIVDRDLNIIHFQGDTSPFLRPTPGEASLQLLRLVRPELTLEVRAAIQEAKKSNTPARREKIPYRRNGQIHVTDLEVVPIEGRKAKGVDFVLLFLNPGSKTVEEPQPATAPKPEKKQARKEVDQLKRELASTQDHLRSLLEDQEAASEELRAANEEILSSNEELQSTNEELETAKEELQSSNEELTTLNEELQNRNAELTQTASDLNSVLNAVEIPIAILGEDRTVRRFTPAAGKLLNLIASDIGRPIAHVRSNLDGLDLDQMAAEVNKNAVSLEREARTVEGHWYAVRMRPFQTGEHTIDGVSISFVDIHDVKQYFSAIVETMRGCLLVLDSHFRVLLASAAFFQTFHVSTEETENRLLWELGNGQWNILQLRELLERVLPLKKEVMDFEVEHDFPAIGRRIMLLNARQLYQAGIGSEKVLLVIEDITERKLAQRQLEEERAELVRSQQMLAEQRTLLVEMGRIARIGAWEFDLADQAFTWTEMAAKISEIDPEVQPSMETRLGLFEAGSRRMLEAALRQAADENRPYDLELQMITAKGNHRWVRSMGVPVQEGDRVVKLRGTFQDITERKEAEEQVRQSERRFQYLADHAPVMIWMDGPDQQCTWCNKPWLDFVGQPMEKELGTGWANHIHPDDADRCLRLYTESFDARQGLQLDYRIRRHDGEYRWVHDTGIPLFGADRIFQGYIGCCIDITERRQAQTTLESTAVKLQESQRDLRALSAQLLKAREDESERLARELHDAFGQKLALLNLKISQIETMAPGQPVLAAEQLRSCREEIGLLAQEIQEFSRQLHPSTLRELGLEVALRSECNAYAQRTGTEVNFRAENIPEELPEDVARCLYRIAQEGLQNIWKHAETNRVDLRLDTENSEVVLIIEDFGKGFDLESTRGKGGLGLISMQERVRLVGGSLSIATRAGDGTRLEARIPLRSD